CHEFSSWLEKMSLALFLLLELCGLSSGLHKQHFFVNIKKTWDEATSHCQRFHHNLSSFTDSKEEQQFLKSARHQTSNAWVGLQKPSRVWMWSGGEAATRITWDENEPDGNGACGLLFKATRKIHDRACSSRLPFFCMNKVQFVLEQQSKPWEDAVRYCQENHGDLATLNSTSWMNVALEDVRQAQTENVWVGLRFLAGRWFWISGGHLGFMASSVTGASRCPDGRLRCGAVNRRTRALTLRDCEEQLSFLCHNSNSASDHLRSALAKGGILDSHVNTAALLGIKSWDLIEFLGITRSSSEHHSRMFASGSMFEANLCLV
ncbi:hypothetical protein DNTS_016936, partial [Danionella cerebrum]